MAEIKVLTNKIGIGIRRVGLTALLLGTMGLSLAACGGEAATPAATTAAATATTDSSSEMAATPEGTAGNSGMAGGEMQEMKLSLVEWAIVPKDVTVNAGKVRFTVTNDGQFTHNAVFIIQQDGKEIARTPNFKSDKNPQILEADLAAGTYKMVCDLPGHEAKGMVGTLTVK